MYIPKLNVLRFLSDKILDIYGPSAKIFGILYFLSLLHKIKHNFKVCLCFIKSTHFSSLYSREVTYN